MNKNIVKVVIGAAISAVLLAGCGGSNGIGGNDTVGVCTDRTTGQRIADDRCDRNGGSNGNFIWYYLLASHLMPSYGQPVYGGSYTAPRDSRIFRGGIPATGGRVNYSKFNTNKSTVVQPKSTPWYKKSFGNSGSGSGTKSNTNSGTKSKSWFGGGSSGGYKSGGYSGRSGGYSGGGYRGGISGTR